MSVKVGDKAPDFSLKSFSHSDEPVEYSLGSFKGKNLLLFFFPQAFSGVCTEEMSTASDEFHNMSKLDLEVIGISVDGTFVQKAFAKNNNIKIPLLSDHTKEVIRKYDVVQEDFAHGMKNVAKRAVFLIDKTGIIRYTETTENPGVQINFAKLKDALKSLN